MNDQPAVLTPNELEQPSPDDGASSPVDVSTPEPETSRPPSPPPPPPVYDIEIDRFRQVYDRFVAVEDLSLKIPKGCIAGFVGHNGAGKTTTLLLLATLLNPTRGEARVAGFSCTRQRAKVRSRMGYMPDVFGVYEGLTSEEYLRFFAEAAGVERARIKATIDNVIDLLRFNAQRQTPVDGLSRGQLQRLSLARTLLHDPQVLLLDEPAAGLDPLARLELLSIIRELRAIGKTILLSSHILSDIADCCDVVAVMARGKLVAFDTVAAIRRQARPHLTLRLTLAAPSPHAIDVVRAFPGVLDARAEHSTISFDYQGSDAALADLHRELVGAQVPVVYCEPVDVRLEDAFAQLLEGDAPQE